ncbi:MAG TPA: iron ABC transporter permease [Leptolyngbya sp.]|jgi:iron(III) transport system permease protein|nr:iron ABC transporter permease [Leptolyngbya sp.]
MWVSRQKAARRSGWTIVVIAIAGLISFPIVTVLSGLFVDARSTWQHLAETVLATYITNSLLLMGLVAIGVAVIGTGTAWLVTLCRFPASRSLTWALLLPLAAPAYILAYLYRNSLDVYGIVQTSLQSTLGWNTSQNDWFPDVRSLWGAALMLILVLYPYVYLLARSAFLSQSVCTLEASRSLGCSPWQSFRKVALPLARPAIGAGVSLALMETLNDYATVQFFGVETFTTGIYHAWFGSGERPAATQLSALLLIFIFALILIEQFSRGRRKYDQPSRSQAFERYQLRGIRAIAAFTFCIVPVLLGFLVPGGLLLKMTLSHWDQAFDGRFWNFASHSLIVSGLAAGSAIVLGMILAYGLRLNRSFTLRVATSIASMGYAIPGSVIAVGILVPFGWLDNAIDQWMRSTFNLSTGSLLSGTIFALIFAYVVRFLALSLSRINSSLINIKPSLDDASRSLGFGATATLLRIHIPLLWKGILAAAILVFVDVMRELSATLIVRPFNFDTLATHVYDLASEERLIEASGSALAIVLVGLIPVILLSWQMEKS